MICFPCDFYLCEHHSALRAQGRGKVTTGWVEHTNQGELQTTSFPYIFHPKCRLHRETGSRISLFSKAFPAAAFQWSEGETGLCMSSLSLFRSVITRQLLFASGSLVNQRGPDNTSGGEVKRIWQSSERATTGVSFNPCQRHHQRAVVSW